MFTKVGGVGGCDMFIIPIIFYSFLEWHNYEHATEELV